MRHFPQEERLLENEYSINLPAQYNLKSKWRKSWVNIPNPFRGLLVLGSPGSGKTYFVIRHVITQHIGKKYSMFIYDLSSMIYPGLHIIHGLNIGIFIPLHLNFMLSILMI